MLHACDSTSTDVCFQVLSQRGVVATIELIIGNRIIDKQVKALLIHCNSGFHRADVITRLSIDILNQMTDEDSNQSNIGRSMWVGGLVMCLKYVNW